MPTLHWIGKEKVINHHQEVPYRVLEKQYEFNTESGSSENKIIQGDNLEALKSLLPEYEGRINCIYIDPPYNTGNENWVYNDNVNHPKIKKWLGETVGKEGEDLSRHDKWLCMMYPRLKLLHKLLAKEGSFWLSIDDNSVVFARTILDEIFGPSKFIATNVWQKRYSRENRGSIGDSHEYILVYSKNPEAFKMLRNKVPIDEKQKKLYKNPDNDPKGPWQSVSLTAQGYRPNQMYSIEGPDGKLHFPPEGRCWGILEENYFQLRKANKITFGQNGKGVPRLKMYLEDAEGLVPWTWWPHEDVGHTDEAKKEMHLFFEKDGAFDTPKPVRLIRRVLEIATSKNSIILDSFAGSGTTAHAVLNLNKEDGGNRKFILIEMEDYADSITAERVRRVIQGYGSGSKAVEGTGGDFGFYALGPALFDTEGNLNEAVPISEILSYIWYSETRTKWTPPVDHADRYYLGSLENTAYYFIYDPDRLTTLDFESLSAWFTQPAEQYICYADNCLLPEALMQKHRIIFKKIPRDITRF
ncbi:site-specific DNA-methyltransferase [Algoriphagus algorifonticola]|uniref:site-specific DNA-methyltransferase n=1 Tax=Algoriphagus algorifonticola TaxID=2593007 RepID=UPI0011A28DC7|nr:site-specific DNA-methyltransferase [Algoriphagus algorifonticola]